MIEVHKNLFVGNEQDCFSSNGFVIIHACKSPCHQRALNYRGSLPQNHPNYLTYENGDDLFLNMVDMKQPLLPKFATPICVKALEFIDKNIEDKKVLIHCNHGLSRSPSLALLYLAKKGAINNESYNKAVESFIKLFSNYNPNNGIASYLRSEWENLMKDD